MTEIKTEYKGVEIRFIEYVDAEKWGCDFGTYQTLKSARQAIDRHTKVDFKRFDVFISTYEGFEKATVTSRGEDGNFWITKKDGSRSKAGEYQKLFVMSADNLALIKKIQELNSQRKHIEEDVRKLELDLVLLREDKGEMR